LTAIRPLPQAGQPARSQRAAGGHRTVRVGLYVAVAQTAALVVAAGLTGSSAIKTQTATSLADVAGSVFLLIGVITSRREADERHPLGYGRERFFWSFLAAVGVLLGGFGAAAVETVQAALHPEPAGHYLVGYVTLAVIVGLDTVALAAGLRPLRGLAAERGMSSGALLWRGTDPAATTVVLTSAAGVVGGLLALAGLAVTEITGRAAPDTVASALIGVVLLAASIALLHTNRELLTGRGLPADVVAGMRTLVARQTGVVAVADIFAVVVGPGTVIVDGDVVFEDALDVPAVERVIVEAAAALRRNWPAIAYVYLNPVAQARTRKHISGGAPPSPRPTSTSERLRIMELASIDLLELARELHIVRISLDEMVLTTAQRADMESLAMAEVAADEGYPDVVASHLADVGGWTIGAATDVNASVAASAIRLAIRSRV
jgi:cation diffusion facilitator family transporter